MAIIHVSMGLADSDDTFLLAEKNKMTAHVHFHTRLAKIEGRVKALCSNQHLKSRRVLEREANTCDAELEHLYSYAVQHEIDVTPHYSRLTQIQADLTDAKQQLESKARSVWGPSGLSQKRLMWCWISSG